MTYDRLKVDDEQLLDVLLAARRRRRHGLRPCREPRHDLLDGEAAARAAAIRGAEVPRHLPSRVSRDRGVHPADRHGRADRPADHDLPRLDRRGRRGDPRGARAGAEGVRRDLPAISLPHRRRPRQAGRWKAPNGCAARRARRAADQEALWQALALGDLQTVSSDHAPYRFDETGKLRAGPNPHFKQIANGMPGLEVRLPLMFDAMVSQGPPGAREVRRADRDGPGEDLRSASAQGHDRDRRRRRHRDLGSRRARSRSRDEMMHDPTGYTPYAGRNFRGWPETVLVRGRVIVGRQAFGRSRAPAASSRARAARRRGRPAGSCRRWIPTEFRRDASVICPPRCVRIEI